MSTNQIVTSEKLEAFCNKLTADLKTALERQGFTYDIHKENSTAHYHINRKYTNVDIGSSGRYMIENETGRIFGIKAYGVIHRGHYFGTLDEIDGWFWGAYYGVYKKE